MSEEAQVPTTDQPSDSYQSPLWKALGKIGKWALIVFSVAQLLAVTVFDPEDVSVWLFGLDLNPAPAAAEVDRGSVDDTTRAVMNGITTENVTGHFEALVSDKSRAAGYEGEKEAAHYILSRFQKAGLQDVRVDTFNVVVPLDKGGRAVFSDGKSVPIAAVWPNHVKTPCLPRSQIMLGDSTLGNISAVWTDKPHTFTVPDAGLTLQMTYVPQGDVLLTPEQRHEMKVVLGEYGPWNIIDFSKFNVKGNLVVLDLVGRVEQVRDSGILVNADSLNALSARDAGASAIIFRNYRKIVLLDPHLAFQNLPEDILYLSVDDITGETLASLSGQRVSIRPGIRGELLYAGTGNHVEFNGRNVDGSIVVMDFACQRRYINAMTLRAKAVILIDDGKVNRTEAEQKFTHVPVEIPRFYADGEAAAQLKALGSKPGNMVTLESRMEWTAVESYNIYGKIPGKRTNRPEDTVVLEAYYDAASVVPAKAYGAETACGIVSLLSIVETFSTHPPDLPVLFLATSGHHQSLAGITEWLYRHARTEDDFLDGIPEEDQITFGLFIGLDISSHNDQIATFAQGTFYTGWNTDSRRTNMHTGYGKAFMRYASELYPGEKIANREAYPRFVDAIAPAKRSWRSFMPVMMAYDHEPVNYVGLSAITMATTNDLRLGVDTPVDTLGAVDIANVVSQAQTVAGLLHRGARDKGFFQETKIKPRDTQRELTGRILQFDRSKSFIPNTPIPGAIVAINYTTKTFCGVRGLQTTLSNSGPGDGLDYAKMTVTDTLASSQKPHQIGRFRFHMVYPHVNTFEVRAYRFGDDGRTLMAPDLGEEGDKTYPLKLVATSPLVQTLQVLFECRALSLFEIIDSRYLSVLDFANIRGADGSELRSYSFDILLLQSIKEGEVEVAAVMYAKPGKRVKVMLSTSLFGIKYLLINSPKDMFDNPLLSKDIGPVEQSAAEGSGYPIGMAIVDRPAYRVARDMWVIDDVRMKTLQQFGVSNQRVVSLHDQAYDALQKASVAYSNQEYDKFTAYSRRAWGLEARGYPDVKGTALDTVQGVVFYFALLLPFAFFMERLVIGAADVRRQLLGFGLIFVGVFLVLQFVHPAFKLSASPYVIFLGFVIFALGSIVTVIIVNKFNYELKRMKMTAAGMHETDVGRLEATAAAIKLGINNLRKRPTRTSLTAVTIAILTFSVLSFTSVVTQLKFYKLGRANPPAYDGMLIRDRNWLGLQPSVSEFVRSAFENHALITERAWFTAQMRADKTFIDFINPANGMRSFSSGLLGLMTQESKVTGIDSLIVAGRWFREGDRGVCIMPRRLATLVGIKDADVGTATIDMQGESWRVIGIVNDDARTFPKDLDDEMLTPVDLVAEESRMSEGQKEDPTQVTSAEVQTFTHISPENIILLPFSEVDRMGGMVRSLAVNRFMYNSRSLLYFASLKAKDNVLVPIGVANGSSSTDVAGFLGIDAGEMALASLDGQLLSGRWFSKGDSNVCVLTSRLAETLGASTAGTIRIAGKDLTVVGVLQDSKTITSGLSRTMPVPLADNVVIVPHSAIAGLETATSVVPPAEGLRPKVAVSNMVSEIEAFMSRVALTTFVGADDKVEIYSSLGATSLKGLANLGVPIVVAALIVLNTMLGAVYDRKREISIFATVGLTPLHIAALFIAEACVFAVIGAVWGYLIGQVLAISLSGAGLLSGISLNYSSLSAVSSTIIVMITVLLSSLYPAKVAADSAVPDVTRRWEFPPADGDFWFFQFPFTVGQSDVVGLYAYLAKVLDAYGAGSTGEFVAQDVGLQVLPAQNGEDGGYRLTFRTWLAPYDLGISQDIQMDAVRTGDNGIFRIDMMIHRLSGDIDSWQRINRGFMQVMRKRFLVWRTVPPGLKEAYLDRGARIFRGEEVEDTVDI